MSSGFGAAFRLCAFLELSPNQRLLPALQNFAIAAAMFTLATHGSCAEALWCEP